MGVDRVPPGRLNARMSYVSNPIHLVFSPKERRNLITLALRERLWPFMGGIARENKIKAIEIGAQHNVPVRMPGVAEEAPDRIRRPASVGLSSAVPSGLDLFPRVPGSELPGYYR